MAKKCDLGLPNRLTGELGGLQYSSLPVFMQVRVFAAIILMDVANKMCSLKSEQLGIPRGCVQHLPLTRSGLCLDIKIRVPCFTASVSSNILVLSNVSLTQILGKRYTV